MPARRAASSCYTPLASRSLRILAPTALSAAFFVTLTITARQSRALGLCRCLPVSPHAGTSARKTAGLLCP